MSHTDPAGSAMNKVGSHPESRQAKAYAQHRPASRQSALRGVPWRTLGVIAAGGVIGVLARQGLWTAFPHRTGAFDWTTLGINAGGCVLIGALMTAIGEVGQAHRLTGRFLGIGVLGGFTTFSTYIIEIQQSIRSGAPQTGLAYLAATLAAALLGVYAGVTLIRALSRLHSKERS
jgi:fluoride exporter